MNKPFGPALNAAVNLLSQQLQQALNQILVEEAKSLGLPDGWSVDVQTRTWILPENTEKADAPE